MIPLRILQYRKEDQKEVLSLIREVWGEEFCKKSRLLWNWKYETHPWLEGRDPNVFLLRNGEKVTGILSSIPLRLQYFDEEIKGFWLMDLMTHPRYRGAGFRLMRFVERREPLIQGFANEKAFKLWARLAKFPIKVGRLRPWIKPLRPAALLRAKLKSKGAAFLLGYLLRGKQVLFHGTRKRSPSFSFEEVDSFPREMDLFWKEASSGYSILQVRDSVFLNWRFPAGLGMGYRRFIARREGRICGYLVLRILAPEGLVRCRIVDFLCNSSDLETFRELLIHVEKLMQKEGADLIECLENDHSGQRDVLKSLGYFLGGRVPNGGFLFIGKNDFECGDRSRFLNRRNWFLTWADGDIDMI